METKKRVATGLFLIALGASMLFGIAFTIDVPADIICPPLS